MGTASNILKVIPTIQAASLANRNLKFSQRKHLKARDFIRQGVENITATSLMKEEAKFLDID